MPVTLRFDRLDTGELVAIHQGCAAIVFGENVMGQARWTLAGDPWADQDPLAGDGDRPSGTAALTTSACAEAARALGEQLGITVDGWEVADG